MESIVTNLLSIAVGALVTWLVARRYYEKATKDLQEESQKIRFLINALARGLHGAGLIDATFQDGELTSLQFTRELGGVMPAPTGELQGTKIPERHVPEDASQGAQHSATRIIC